MSAINFPSSPSNGQTLVTNDAVYTYNSAKGYWDGVSTLTGIQLASISVGANAPASGDGGLAYNSASGVFTYTPPVSADPLPAQTGNTGKYLTTDGSTTSWAEVASGGGNVIEYTSTTSADINDVVMLNSDGTVSPVEPTNYPLVPQLYGYQFSDRTTGSKYGRGMMAHKPTDRSAGMVVYSRQGGTYIIQSFTAPGGVFSMGATATLGAGSKIFPFFDPFDDTKVLLLYTTSGNAKCTVIDTAANGSISLNPEIDLGDIDGSSGVKEYQIDMVNSVAGNVKIIASVSGYVTQLTWDGTNITAGTPIATTANGFHRFSLGQDGLFAMIANTTLIAGKIDWSANTVSEGAPTTVISEGTQAYAVSEAGKIAYAYRTAGFGSNGMYVQIYSINTSTYACTALQSPSFLQQNYNSGQPRPSEMMFAPGGETFGVSWYGTERQSSSSSDNKARIGTVSDDGTITWINSFNPVSTSDTSYNFFEANDWSNSMAQKGLVGFYSEAFSTYDYKSQPSLRLMTFPYAESNLDVSKIHGLAASSGTTIDVTLENGIHTGLSGLTTGSTYYVLTNGTLSTSPDSNNAQIGMAINATSLSLDFTNELTSSSLGLYATKSYVDTAVSNLVDSSPAALNTLNELAAALGDDANFSTTVTNTLATKAPLASPTFTGVPVAPTATAGTNTTQLATTAFVAAATAAAAGDTLPAQTGNTGKYLTTDGSTTSWATVASGASYEIGDGLELNSLTTIDWSTLPSPLTEINGIASEQYFGGIGLSASDTHIVIGTPGGAGAATAFDVYSAETGAFLRSIGKIDPAALGDGGFGAFVSISGTKVIMGHPLAASVAGAAYIFEATTGALLHTLSAPTGGAVTTGQAVAISPNYAAVLSLTSAQTSSRIGVYNVSTGALLHTIAQVTNGNGHGSLSITDQYLVAGEPLRDRAGQPTSDNSGAVSVYDTATGSLLHTIVEPTPSVSGDFGFSVSVHGDYIAIGGAPSTYGAVYIYSASTGSLLHTFQNPLSAETGTTYNYGFGNSVSVYGDHLLVGALDGPKPGTIGDSWGRAYLYDLTNGSLIQTISGTNNNDQLGDSVAIGPGIIAIGVPQYDSNGLTNNGKAVIYKTDVTTNTYLQPDNTIATTSSPTFTGVTTLTATSEVLQPKFSAGFGAVDHNIANGSIFYHDLMMGNFDAAFINVPTTVDLVTSAVLVMAEGEMWGPSSYVRVNGTEYVVKWLGGTAPTMSADVVDVVSYSLINRNGTWVVIGSHSAYSAAV